MNLEVDAYNNHIFAISHNMKYTAKAVDSVVESVSSEMTNRVLALIPNDPRKTLQLPRDLQLVLEGRYELSTNVNVPDGLANGTSGLVKRVDLSNTNSQASGIVWMEFENNHVGIQTRKANQSLYQTGIGHDWTPIRPISRQFQVGRSEKLQVIRKQFPLRHSTAKSIHRSQGDTLHEAVVEFISSRKQAHIHYVGLSRVRTLENLHILNLNPTKIHVSPLVKEEMSQLRGDRQLKLALPFVYSLDNNLIKLAFLNARSFHSHFASIKADQSLNACDLHVYCETFMTTDEVHAHTYDITGYGSYLYPAESNSHTRPHYGLAVYTTLRVAETRRVSAIHQKPTVSNIECVLTVIQLQHNIKLNVACLYSRPTTPVAELTSTIHKLLAQLDQLHHDAVCHQYIIMADFNVDLTHQPNVTMMAQLLSNYRQLVSGPTTDYQSLIDHVYTDIAPHLIQCFTGDCYYSDHKPVYLTLSANM